MKILIVGAGPIGCYEARLLKNSSNGLGITVIEEHPEIGRPVHCAGLVSKDVFAQSKINIDGNTILNTIDGAEFFLNGDSFKIKRKESAVVVNREEFDRALGVGLEVNFNTRFVGIEREGKGYLVETDKGEYYADIVIGADGANSLVRKSVGFKERIEYLRGVQFRLRCNKNGRALVQVYLKKPFFAWVIPEDDTTVRVGIISHNPYHDLLGFLKEINLEGEILEKFAGVVPLGTCQTQKENLVLVGDAACQVKPLTHGGVYYGMRCAEILAECILENRITDYEERWKKQFEREIVIGLKLKQIYQNLSHENTKRLFTFLKNNSFILERFGDFENHSKVIPALIKNQNLQGLLGRLLIGVFKDAPL